MKQFVKLTAVYLCVLLLLSALFGCKKDHSTPNADEPAASTGSEPFTPEDVFRILVNTDQMKLSISYTEVETDGTVAVNESAVVEKSGDLVKAVLVDNDENTTFFYDLENAVGYQQDTDGAWSTTSLEDTMPDWEACLQQAFSIEGMNSRLDWLFSSDTYEAYDADTGRCLMKAEEMVGFFGENWTEMKAYLMQSGNTYTLFLSTADSVGTFTFKAVIELCDVTVTLPK